MSRAFVHEDSGDRPSGRRFILPASDHPGCDAEATKAILEAARHADTGSAEQATGYYWGEPRLRPHVDLILAAPPKERAVLPGPPPVRSPVPARIGRVP